MSSSKKSFAAILVLVSISTLTLTTNAFQSVSPLTRPLLSQPPRVSHQARSSSSRLFSSVAISTALTALDTFWQTSPYTAAAIVCGIKASAADLIAQKRAYRKREEKERQAAALAASQKEDEDSLRTDNTPIIYNPNIDETAAAAAEDTSNSNDTDTDTALNNGKKTEWKRTLAFLTYGSIYQGLSQEFIYIHLYPVWFGSATTVPVVLTKVLFDLCIQTTFLTLPIAYLTKSVIYRYSPKEAIRRYIDDIRNHGLLKKYYLLWGPVQCLTFSIVPEHWRVTFIAFVSFFWLIILSTIASKTKATSEDVQNEIIVEECSFEDGTTCNIDG
ncbi:Mpv17 / PMP22 family [Seminavis robusta]|uniref:Mpv17 / PMP22 family n=1 Tax=Seminavis robusta TaxID=568900 RepID=A0A9N8DI68_9STRA|nr:Mpv17 / PMP22 family [Seminavis robusta]|eukprot:Sro97_g050140.1 Mpv17 / PMP22 family (330) ;mRNA; f:102972-103961